MTALLIGSEELTERWNGRKSATVVFAVSLVVLAAAALGGTLIPETAYQPAFGRTNLPPGAGGLFGTDWLGRDMLARTLKGLSISIWIGLFTSMIISLSLLACDVSISSSFLTLFSSLTIGDN